MNKRKYYYTDLIPLVLPFTLSNILFTVTFIQNILDLKRIMLIIFTEQYHPIVTETLDQIYY